jgi:DNA polymerase I
MPLKVHKIGIRECFVPRPGNCFIDADVEGLELNTLAQVEIWTIKDDTKAKQLNSGMDLHCVTGAVIAGVDYASFFRGAKGHEPGNPELATKKVQLFKDLRGIAKIPNFGKPGGMADETLVGFARTSYGVKLGATPDNLRPSKDQANVEAKRIGTFWRKANPCDVEYLDFIRTLRKGDRYDVIMGHPSIGHILRRGNATYCAAANSLFQGLGAIAAAEITWAVQTACYIDTTSPLYGWRLVMHAYDEWLLEGPIGRQTEAAAELERLIIECGQRKVPDVVFRTEAVAMCQWAKAAERVVRDGELLIWGTDECDDYLRSLKAAA